MSIPSQAAHLTRSGLLARNSLFNLIGQGIPLLVALFAIPLLIRGLGTDRFGVLTLAWMIIGYFSLFDLGLSRALTQVVSDKLSAGEAADTPQVIWSAMLLMLLLGIAGAAIAAPASASLLDVLKIPRALHEETLISFYLLAAAIPLVIVTAGLAGVLSALQRFDVLNALRVPMGLFNYLAPLVVLPFSQSLLWIIAVLLFGRVLACVAHLIACLKVMPALRIRCVPKFASIKPLFHFGAWITVSNIIGPLMVYLDRFVIGALASVAAVAYYATAYEMVTKLWMFPGAILGVLFPAFAATYARDPNRTAALFARGSKYVALLLFPITLAITGFAREGLTIWLGAEFARHSAPVMQWLAVGVMINSLAQVSATLIQGVGRPALSAKLHLIELPIYLPGLWWAIDRFGIVGAAVAWTLRVTIDAVLLFWLSARLLKGHSRLMQRIAIGNTVAVIGVALPLFFNETTVRVATVSILLAIFFPVVWLVVFSVDERARIVGFRNALHRRYGAFPR